MLVPGQEARATGEQDAGRRKSGGGGLLKCVRFVGGGCFPCVCSLDGWDFA